MYLLRAFVDVKLLHKHLDKGYLLTSGVLRASNIHDNRHGETTEHEYENTDQNTHFDLLCHYN